MLVSADCGLDDGWCYFGFDGWPCAHEFVGEGSGGCSFEVARGVGVGVFVHFVVGEDARVCAVDDVVDSLKADEFHPSFGDVFIDVDGEAPVIEDGFALDGVC